MEFMKSTNPVREAFKIWKQETVQIISQKYAIRQSIADKEELRQQFELLNSQNQDSKAELVAQVRQACIKRNGAPCEECADLQISKVEALAEIKHNMENYQELHELVGYRGMS